MGAFQPIAPRAALSLLSSAELGDDAAQVLVDFAQAGVVRGYARMVEVAGVDGSRKEIRDARIDREIWRRIVEQGKIGEVVATGSVRLAGSREPGGAQPTNVIGIRFDEGSVVATARHHGGGKSKPPAKPISVSDLPNASEAVSVVTPRPPLAADAVALSVPDTAAVLGVSRSTVYNLVSRGDLVAKKIGARTIITADSIRAMIAA